MSGLCFWVWWWCRFFSRLTPDDTVLCVPRWTLHFTKKSSIVSTRRFRQSNRSRGVRKMYSSDVSLLPTQTRCFHQLKHPWQTPRRLCANPLCRPPSLVVQVWISASDSCSCHFSCLWYPCSSPFDFSFPSLPDETWHCSSLIDLHWHLSNRLGLGRRRYRGPVVSPQRLSMLTHLFSDSPTEGQSFVSASQASLGLRIPRNSAACLFQDLLSYSNFNWRHASSPLPFVDQLKNSERLSFKFHHEDCVQLQLLCSRLAEFTLLRHPVVVPNRPARSKPQAWESTVANVRHLQSVEQAWTLSACRSPTLPYCLNSPRSATTNLSHHVMIVDGRWNWDTCNKTTGCVRSDFTLTQRGLQGDKMNEVQFAWVSKIYLRSQVTSSSGVNSG